MMADLVTQLPGGALDGDTGIVYAIGIVLIGLVTAFFVKRYAISTDYRARERQQLSEDTQYIIDNLQKRYDELDTTHTTKVAEVYGQLQNMAIQYSAAVVQNGELEARASVAEARVQTLESELSRVREEIAQLTAADQFFGRGGDDI